MHNYLLFPYNETAEKLSQQFGFEKTFFLGRELEMVTGTPKEILRKASSARNKQLIYLATDDRTLRFVLEKTPIKIVMGMEKMFGKDSLHYPKSGLNQILCKIAADEDKIIAFSFSEVLNSKNTPQLLKRIAFNLKLCKKYKVKFIFGNFSRSIEEMRSAKDLDAFRRVLEKKKLY